MGARGARRGRRRLHTQTGTQGALVQYYDWAGCAVRRTCLGVEARGAHRGRRRSHTQTGTLTHRAREYSIMTGLVALSGGHV